MLPNIRWGKWLQADTLQAFCPNRIILGPFGGTQYTKPPICYNSKGKKHGKMSKFEYSVMVQGMDIPPQAVQAGRDELAQTLTIGLGKLIGTMSNAVESFQGGGWEIVSHELTPFGTRLVVSFLLRRAR